MDHNPFSPLLGQKKKTVFVEAPSSYCYCFGPEMTCDLYGEGTLLRCGKIKLTMLNFDLVGAVPVFVQCFAGQTYNMMHLSSSTAD